jgi:hypothetical protein
MKPNTLLKALCSLVLIFTLVVTSLPTSSFALQIYPVDYTFTGIGLPDADAFVTVIDDKGVGTEFQAKVNADGLYTIPAKITTATGQISTQVETTEGLEVSIFLYDVSTLDTAAGGTIEPAIYVGTNANPNSNVKVTFPDGSTSIVKSDDTGAFKAFAPNAQDAGPVKVATLDGLGLEVGTPKVGNYTGGVEVVQATQVKVIQAATVSSSKTLKEAELIIKKNPDAPATPVTPNVILQNVAPTTAPATVPAKVTVRTGGVTDYSIAAVIALMATSFYFIKNKKTAK